MGWINELSSMVFSMGHKLISGGDKQCASAAGDNSLSELCKFEQVDEFYRPHDLAEITKIYKPVEPSDLISKQQTTMIYLT